MGKAACPSTRHTLKIRQIIKINIFHYFVSSIVGTELSRIINHLSSVLALPLKPTKSHLFTDK